MTPTPEVNGSAWISLEWSANPEASLTKGGLLPLVNPPFGGPQKSSFQDKIWLQWQNCGVKKPFNGCGERIFFRSRQTVTKAS
jgi:hypothetical protein